MSHRKKNQQRKDNRILDYSQKICQSEDKAAFSPYLQAPPGVGRLGSSEGFAMLHEKTNYPWLSEAIQLDELHKGYRIVDGSILSLESSQLLCIYICMSIEW